MNCEKGDIAMVVRDTTANGFVSHTIGTPIEVEHLIDHCIGPFLTFTGPRLCCPVCGEAFAAFFDADLQPLRPGPAQGDTSDSQDIFDGVAYG